MEIQITHVTDPRHLEQIRVLLREYGDLLGDHLRFQNFDHELAELPGHYSPPSGCILLATVDNQPAGCVALRPVAEGSCEMKRLYVRPAHRGLSLGRKLAQQIIHVAQQIGYETMRLDTMPSMTEAYSLYQSLRFREITCYNQNPLPGVKFMELRL